MISSSSGESEQRHKGARHAEWAASASSRAAGLSAVPMNTRSERSIAREYANAGGKSTLQCKSARAADSRSVELHSELSRISDELRALVSHASQPMTFTTGARCAGWSHVPTLVLAPRAADSCAPFNQVER